MSVDLNAFQCHEGERVFRYGVHEIELTKIEFELAALLLRDPLRVFTHDEIALRLFGYTEQTRHSVHVHVARLRSKVKAVTGVDVIRSVRAVGYSFIKRSQLSPPPPGPSDLRVTTPERGDARPELAR